MRVALITGAARGLGVAIARGLAQAGARVVLTDIDAAGAEAAAKALREAGHDTLALKLDVRDEADFQHAFDAATAHFGGIDILVNNAAVTPHRSLWDITMAEWDEVMAVNLRGCFFGSRIAARHMRERGWGRILNLSSLAGQQASSVTGAHYAASKAGLFALTRSFAQVASDAAGFVTGTTLDLNGGRLMR